MNPYLAVAIIVAPLIAIVLVEANHRGWMRGFNTAVSVTDGIIKVQQIAIETLIEQLTEQYQELTTAKHKLAAHNGS